MTVIINFNIRVMYSVPCPKFFRYSIAFELQLFPKNWWTCKEQERNLEVFECIHCFRNDQHELHSERPSGLDLNRERH